MDPNREELSNGLSIYNPRQTRPPGQASSVKTVLAVDDNLDDLFFLKYALSPVLSGGRLLTATDCAEAEELLQSMQAEGCAALPGIIFLDIHLPGQNGFQLLQRIKQTPPYREIPVVMLSTFDNASDMNVAYELGAITCLKKPPTRNAVQRLAGTLFSMQS
jgi:CheY-like chemotaxis protein